MTKTKTLTEEERETSGGTLAVILLCVIIIWVAGGWLADFTNKTDRGTFGDMFGAVNSLFSGLAFATLIFTVFLQRRELQLQRQELAETRRELERSASAQEASERALKAQAVAVTQSATLSATNMLLEIYGAQIDRLSNARLHLTDHYRPVYEEYKNRRDSLLSLLDETYFKITDGKREYDEFDWDAADDAANGKNRS